MSLIGTSESDLLQMTVSRHPVSCLMAFQQHEMWLSRRTRIDTVPNGLALAGWSRWRQPSPSLYLSISEQLYMDCLYQCYLLIPNGSESVVR